MIVQLAHERDKNKRVQAHHEQLRQEPQLDPVDVMPGAIQGFDDARDRGRKAHFLEGDGYKIDQEKRKEIRFQQRIEPLLEEIKKGYGGVDEVSRKEKEQWDVKGVNYLMNIH